MSDRRLIEEWLPIAALGEESVRERRSMTRAAADQLVCTSGGRGGRWWRRARRCWRACFRRTRTASASSTSSASTAIRWPPRAGSTASRPPGERLGRGPPTATRGPSRYSPERRRPGRWSALASASASTTPLVLDPTAGGGSIPFEALRLGINAHRERSQPGRRADPARQPSTGRCSMGWRCFDEFKRIGDGVFRAGCGNGWHGPIPAEGEPDAIVPDGYLWARTVRCPYCEGLVPLSPNWRLAPDGTGVRLRPDEAHRPRRRRPDLPVRDRDLARRSSPPARSPAATAAAPIPTAAA